MLNLKIVSDVLRVITVIALLGAFVAWARVKAQASPAQTPGMGAGLGNAAMHWVDDDWGWGWSMPVRDQESDHKTFSVAAEAGHRSIEVDNLFGSIEVSGGDGNDVQMDVEKSYRAESKVALDRAKKEVTLDISQNPGSLTMEVKYPSRCGSPGCWNGNDLPYVVEMNFRLQVPRDSDLTLKTVNGHEVTVRDVNGTFSIHNVNGPITLTNVAGEGVARTVNGSVKASFRESPKHDSQFASLNGSVDLYFPKDLAADFQFKTFTGSVYSDFTFLTSATSTPEQERRGHMIFFRTNTVNGGRVGAGGPMIRVENLNGDIRILENHE